MHRVAKLITNLLEEIAASYSSEIQNDSWAAPTSLKTIHHLQQQEGTVKGSNQHMQNVSNSVVYLHNRSNSNYIELEVY